jgi:hypothetical protein
LIGAGVFPLGGIAVGPDHATAYDTPIVAIKMNTIDLIFDAIFGSL